MNSSWFQLHYSGRLREKKRVKSHSQADNIWNVWQNLKNKLIDLVMTTQLISGWYYKIFRYEKDDNSCHQRNGNYLHNVFKRLINFKKTSNFTNPFLITSKSNIYVPYENRNKIWENMKSDKKNHSQVLSSLGTLNPLSILLTIIISSLNLDSIALMWGFLTFM